jgi:hypothetical protein
MRGHNRVVMQVFGIWTASGAGGQYPNTLWTNAIILSPPLLNHKTMGIRVNDFEARVRQEDPGLSWLEMNRTSLQLLWWLKTPSERQFDSDCTPRTIRRKSLYLLGSQTTCLPSFAG